MKNKKEAGAKVIKHVHKAQEELKKALELLSSHREDSDFNEAFLIIDTAMKKLGSLR